MQDVIITALLAAVTASAGLFLLLAGRGKDGMTGKQKKMTGWTACFSPPPAGWPGLPATCWTTSSSATIFCARRRGGAVTGRYLTKTS